VDRPLTYAEAIHEATEQEMARDPSVVVFGLGVDDFRGIYGTTAGLAEKFGADRTLSKPIEVNTLLRAIRDLLPGGPG